ncbi:MAG: hypothetical protein M3256_25890, partial [Actinomycetota bacterium]|nr:hypothetical protein [Actinomycetota bacterium]
AVAFEVLDDLGRGTGGVAASRAQCGDAHDHGGKVAVASVERVTMHGFGEDQSAGSRGRGRENKQVRTPPAWR